MDMFKRCRKKCIQYYAISNRVNLIEIHSVNINQNERTNKCFHSNADHKALTAVIKIPSNNLIRICHFRKKKLFAKYQMHLLFNIQQLEKEKDHDA